MTTGRDLDSYTIRFTARQIFTNTAFSAFFRQFTDLTKAKNVTNYGN